MNEHVHGDQCEREADNEWHTASLEPGQSKYCDQRAKCEHCICNEEEARKDEMFSLVQGNAACVIGGDLVEYLRRQTQAEHDDKCGS